jgi:GT2 family glycosyltransferase
MIKNSNFVFFSITLVFILLSLAAGIYGNNPHAFYTSYSNLVLADKPLVIYLLMFVLMIFLIIIFPSEYSKRKKIILIVLFSIIIRLCFISFEPSDDVNRYLFEGKVTAAGINPYVFSPADLLNSDLAVSDPYFNNINHKENSAAYPPMMVLIFTFISLSFYSPWPIKLLLIFTDTISIYYIIKILVFKNMNIRWSLLYALNPLILFAIAGHSHFESVQIMFLTFSLYCYLKKKYKLMFLALGMAFQVKYVSIILLPLFIKRANLKYACFFLIPALLFYYPFINFDVLSENRALFYSIIKFGEEYAYNGSIHAMLRFFLKNLGAATSICKILLIITLLSGIYFFHPERKSIYRNNPISGSLFLLTALIVFAPTIHYWYLTWLFPFFIFIRNRSILLLMFTACFTFAVFDMQFNTGQWRLPALYALIGWVPFYIVLIVEIIFFLKGLKYKKYYNKLETISVIIPTYNEEPNIENCIKALSKDSSLCEIIIVDGGSTDKTKQISKKAGAAIIEFCKPIGDGGGRGGQILAGLKQTKSDIVVILHADTILPENGLKKIKEFMNLNRNFSGGALGSTFNAKGKRYRILDFANDFKASILGISFGDQVQFFKRDDFLKNRFFPDIPLMEDLELSIRLFFLGRSEYLFQKAKVSARRWETKGSNNSISIIKRVAVYLLLRIFIMPDTVSMYKDYYGIKKGE